MSENDAAARNATSNAVGDDDSNVVPPGMIRNHLGLIENLIMTEIDWEKRWRKGKDAAWQMGTVHPMLQKYYDSMVRGRNNCRVLVPLCGRTLDLQWLVEKGHTVVGVEFVEIGVVRFFAENHLEYVVEPPSPTLPGKAKIYSSCEGRLKIVNADFFALSRDVLGTFDCVWDRGALAATNPSNYSRYFRVINDVLDDSGVWMLDSFDFTNPDFHGPPFRFNAKSIEDSLGSNYDIRQLDYFPNLAEKFKKWGLGNFYEMVHILTKKRGSGDSAHPLP
ncbi:probable thiopurine S-methyltransferase [Oscarella lobularis]|uniref:probable thiopurine S-methyltransferase n=1 Tax=Oscarella lobularis TaxID=121494 RepID=UPI003313CB2A